MKPRIAPLGVLCWGVLLATLIGSCGEGATDGAERVERAPAQGEVTESRDREPRPTRLPPRLSCPAEADNCASARGRILYVEAVDPDGDGDAHFALVERPGITLPGITVVDVGLHLRPEPLPGPGDYLSAVGPVYTGSYGQRQIEATEINFTRHGDRQPR